MVNEFDAAKVRKRHVSPSLQQPVDLALKQTSVWEVFLAAELEFIQGYENLAQYEME